jgi:hypothetical protein
LRVAVLPPPSPGVRTQIYWRATRADVMRGADSDCYCARSASRSSAKTEELRAAQTINASWAGSSPVP